MKKTLLFTLSLIFALQITQSFAQSGTCMPDTTVVDTTGGLGVIFPLPYDETTMTGGIPITACQNQPFELVFTAKIPEMLEFNGFPVGVDSIQINNNGVLGLPDGLTYACNPPSCAFQAGTFGCLVVYGTPTADVGDYNMQLDLFIATSLLSQDFIEPGALFPGTYTLTVEEEGSPSCFTVGTSDILRENLSFAAVPNPFGNYTQIQVHSGINQDVFFEVHDLLGNELFVQPINLQEGQNTIEFDGSPLAEGMYIYSLRKDNAVISKKMIITRS